MFRFHKDRLQTKVPPLGKGRFGKVFAYQKNPEDLRWAVKRIKAEDAEKLVSYLPEIVIGFACNHPSVVPIKGYFIERNADKEGFDIYMKLPRMKEALLDDLKERQKEENHYSEHEIIRYFYSLVCGIEYLHTKKIYHGDIKPDNLLLDEQGTLKLGDIGIAKHVEEEDSYQTLTRALGTYQYSAPEILGEMSKEKKKGVLAKGDIWSLGVVMLELCCLRHQLLSISLPQDKLQNDLNGHFNSLEGRYSVSLIALIQRILNFDPKDRPDIGEIKTELEKEFSQILSLELLPHENPQLIQMEEGSEIAILKQLLQENSQKYNRETKRLKESISKLELELAQQKLHEERIKAVDYHHGGEEYLKNFYLEEKIKGLEEELQRLKVENQQQFDTIAENDKRISSLEEEIRKLQQEKDNLEQRNKDIDMTIEAQMKEYESQITALKEAHFNQEILFCQEKSQLVENMETMQLMIRKLEASLAASQDQYGKDYEDNLVRVSGELNAKWRKTFKFEVAEKKLLIDKATSKIKDASVAQMLKELLLALTRRNLLNLFGLEIIFTGCDYLDDRGFADISDFISAQALHLKHLTLDFSYCRKWTDTTFEHVAKAILNQSKSLQSLSLIFRSVENITDHGVEILTTAIENSCKNLTELNLDFDNYYIGNEVTSQMKASLCKKFAHVPKLEIS